MTLINMNHSDKLRMSHMKCFILLSFLARFHGSLFFEVTCLRASNDQKKNEHPVSLDSLKGILNATLVTMSFTVLRT